MHQSLFSVRLLFICALLSCVPAFADRVLHREQSLYSQIVVRQDGSIICLQFDVRRDQRNQSCMNQRSPKEMVFAYAKMTMTSLLLTPEPRRILIVGLGGGTLPMAFADLLPEAVIDSIEVDEAVVRVAEKFFNYQSTERMRTHIQDARVWIKRAVLTKTEPYDLIILDAFNGEYIPEHLMTKEFFLDLKALLSPMGTVAANTFSISDLYDAESATYAHVFGSIISFKMPQSANRLVLAPPPGITEATLKARSKALAAKLAPYRVPIEKYAPLLNRARHKAPDWDTDAPILTDQYAPANLLQGR